MKQKFMFKDKRGKLLSIWWFFILGLSGLAIVLGVSIFYSASIDVREVESSILYDNLANCVIKQGSVADGVFEDSFDIFESCNLHKETIESGDFYFKIEILNSKGDILKEIEEGSFSFEQDCFIADSITAKKFPKCTDNKESIFYYENGEKKIGFLRVLTASNQDGERS